MSNDSIDIVINTCALDEAQAKADKLLSTLRLIKETQADLPIVSGPPLLDELKKQTGLLEQLVAINRRVILPDEGRLSVRAFVPG